MNKIGLVIRREYLSRVRKKTFILSTILTPLLFVGVMALVMFLTIRNTRKEQLAIVDPSGLLKSSMPDSKHINYRFVADADTGNFIQKGFTGILYAPGAGINKTQNFKVVSDKTMSRMAQDRIEKDVMQAMENNLISQELKIDPMRIDSIKARAGGIRVDQTKRSEIGEETGGQFALASSIGYVTGFLIYIMLFVYGVMVMRGVSEEKTSRIAEVIISSVKPFQLMLGKIIGIGAVGLTQFLIWVLLLVGLSTVLGAMVPADVLQQAQAAQSGMPGASVQGSEAVQTIANAQVKLASIQWGWVIGCFLFYFLGGYLFYASLFAAVGSAVNEDAQDAQSLTFPITIPIIIAIILMINSITDPSSNLATWSSIIPFFSPIVMMSRIPFGVPHTVPYWQLALSMILLVAGFLFTTWLSAKIYRTGILMYGKKPSWKEIGRWIRR